MDFLGWVTANSGTVISGSATSIAPVTAVPMAFPEASPLASAADILAGEGLAEYTGPEKFLGPF